MVRITKLFFFFGFLFTFTVHTVLDPDPDHYGSGSTPLIVPWFEDV
jgi:hypothetical protein